MPGFEYWAGIPNSEGAPTGGIYNFYGDVVSSVKPHNLTTNWVAYWDGDLLSEHLMHTIRHLLKVI